MLNRFFAPIVISLCSMTANSANLFSDAINGTPGDMTGHTSAGGEVLLFDDGEAIVAKGRYKLFDDLSLSGYVLSQKLDPSSNISVEQTGFAVGVVAHQDVPFFKEIKYFNNMDFELGLSIDRRKIEVESKFFGVTAKASSNETLVILTGELRNQLMDRLEVNAITSLCIHCSGTNSKADLSTFSIDAGVRFKLTEGLFATSLIDVDGFDFIGFGLEYHFDDK